MKKFLDKNFLLDTPTAQTLFHDYAKQMPIIDYHCHIDPKEIAQDRQFRNITEVWLGGDHYKWRLMRSAGVDEYYITGGASDREKFRNGQRCSPVLWATPSTTGHTLNCRDFSATTALSLPIPHRRYGSSPRKSLPHLK